MDLGRSVETLRGGTEAGARSRHPRELAQSEGSGRRKRNFDRSKKLNYYYEKPARKREWTMWNHFLGVAIAVVLAGSGLAHAQTEASKFRSYLTSIPPVPVRNESAADGDVIGPPKSTGYIGTYSNRMATTEESRRLTRNLEKIVAFDPNAGVLYPGSLVQGKSLPDGVLFPIVATRRPQTCTVSGIAGPTAVKYSVTFVPTEANATAAVARILNQRLAEDQPARMTYTETSFNSLDEGVLKLGASYSWLNGKVDGSFSTENANATTRLLVRFVQTYYTVACEAPSDPIAFFTPTTNFKRLRNYVGKGNPPVFINSVTYGRELWMLVESNHSESEIKTALDAAVGFGTGTVKADFDSLQKKTLSESTVQVLVVGGGGKPAVDVVTGDPSKIASFIKAGANFSSTSPGLPISYTAMYLRDNSIARVSSTSDYIIKTAVPDPDPAPVTTVRATWATTGDDKDWDTQPVVDVYDGSGRAIAHIDCCSADRNGDHWTSGRTETRAMQILAPSNRNNVLHGSLSAKRNPKGNDDWDYSLTVEFTFADGSQLTKSCSGRNSCGVTW